MDNKKTDTKEVKPKDSGNSAAQRFGKKAENFFYHYKWHTLIASFLLFVLIWTVSSVLTAPEIDAYLGYIGNVRFSVYQQQDIGDQISSCIDFDVSGDGKTMIDFSTLSYLTDSQAVQEAQEAKKKGEEYDFYYVENAKNYETFLNDINSRDAGVWIVSKAMYQDLDKSRLLPLEDALGYTPEGAVDAYAVECSSLAIIRECAKQIYFDSYIIIRGSRDYSSLMEQGEAIKTLEQNKALFRAIVEYK